MKKLIIAGLWFFYSLFGFAQNDVKAKKALDNLSKKTKGYTSISAEFSVTIENKKNQTNDNQHGKLLLKGSKFKLEINNQTIISDGKTTWTILKDASEIQINAVEEKQKETGINPSAIFTLYEKGFKYEFVKEETLKSGIIQQQIKLFPEESKSKNYHTILLTINKTQLQLTSIKIFGKDGTDITYKVKTFKPDEPCNDNTFVLNEKLYPNFEIIDLR